MNEVMLKDFDAETLSNVSWATVLHINNLKAAGKQELLIGKLREFNVQVVYALSLAKDRERVLSN